MAIKEIVSGLQDKYNTCDPRIIIEALGFVIVDKPWEDVCGAMVRCGDVVAISASTLLPAAVRRYVYAHELGHAILHKGLDVCFLGRNKLLSAGKVERQADAFSALLLLPQTLLNQYNGYCVSVAAAALEVPKKLLEFRLTL